MPHVPFADRRLSRRRMVQIGGAGLLGLTLPGLLRARAADTVTSRAARADHLIVVFLNGGPSHLDMWDMKPAAPVEIRGEFRPIASSLPGVPLCEHLPRLARQMHRTCLVRSVHHSVNNAHAAAVYTALTGQDRGDANVAIGAGRDDYPALGAVAGLMRPVAGGIVPYVSLPYITKEGAGGPPQPGFFGGWLGRNYDPLFILSDPSSPSFGLPELSLGADMTRDRLNGRRGLATALAGGAATAAMHDMAMRDLAMRDLDQFQARAYDLLTSMASQRAFEIQAEPDAVRDRYGRNIYGQSVLLARRLIEAGTRVVSISWAPDANATWDTHGNNFTKLRTDLLPRLDSAIGTLLEDLDTRGLLERTLVAVMGEFGRTPRINTNGGGRDHWNFCYTLMLAGGGVRPGYVHGASDRIGAHPSLNPVRPADVIATIYQSLGIAADLELRDRLNRPLTLVPWGRPIDDILA
jgi:uncharacterized protein (DUF1501 family)